MSKLLNQLIKLNQSDEYPLHMPGHKRNMQGNYLENAYQVDITEIEGYDNLYEPQGILKSAKEHAATVFGAEDTYFLVNGSTVGILTAICAVTGKGDKIIMARNCHKAVYHAVELWELQVSYIYPDILNDWQMADAIDVDILEEQLKQDKNISAVIITSPTYEGIVSDIEKIAELAHKYQIPLIVDEAHGAHFSFHPRFPKSAVYCGADVVVQSIHKTLPSFTQTALLHVNGNLVNRDKIEKYLSFFQTSSPSYLLIAGIDQCVSVLEEKKATLWDDFFRYRDEFISRTSKLRNIRVYNDKTADPCKLVISVKDTNISGIELQKQLLDEFHIQIEMAAETYIIGIVTQSDTEEGFNRLAKALLSIDGNLHQEKMTTDIKVTQDIPQVIYNISKAAEMPFEGINLDNAVNRISAGYINLYPPGIPLLTPGELISEEMIGRLLQYHEEGLHLQGLMYKQEKLQIKVIK